MGAGRSKEPPPEPTFAEIGAMVVEKLRTTVDAQMPFDVTLEILIAMAIGLIGMMLLLKTAAKKAVGSKAIVAVCELTVAGSSGSSVAISPSPGVTDRPKSHLERTPSAKQFVPERASRVSGTVKLVEVDGACVIEYQVSGLTPGKHGFQIHETADFSNGLVSAGGIYNPHGKNHGGLEDANRKVGDLGNIVADPTGVAKGTIRSNLVRLKGPYSIVGRSMMVHADEDDLGRGDNSQPDPPKNGKCSLVTGNVGPRIACGKINLVN